MNDASGVHDQLNGTDGLVLSVSPNPAADLITVTADAPVEAAELMILDQLGRTVHRQPWRTAGKKLTIHVGELPSGVYTLMLRGATVHGKPVHFVRQ